MISIILEDDFVNCSTIIIKITALKRGAKETKKNLIYEYMYKY